MNKKTRVVIGVLFLILLIITACSKENVIQITEETPEIPETTENQPTTGIQEGDLIEMNFVLYGEDGRVIDTNNKEKAQEAELKTYSTGTYKFIVGQSGKVEGFDKAIIGLEKGDKTTLEIPPSTDKVKIEFKLENVQSRIKTIPKKQTFSIKNFEKIFGKKPIKGDVIANRDMFPWPYKLIAVTNNSAAGEIIIKQGDKVELPGTQWQSQATAISDRVIQFLQMPKENQTIETEFGTATVDVGRSQMKIIHEPELGKEFFYTMPSEQLISPRYEFTVSDIGEKTFTIKRINYPEQEKLKLEVEIIEVMPNTEIKKVKSSE
ncbi:hypothetical protein GF358_01290 [Candidatus Woesearchaeota archaeon]|nr:hypothetical protein [Candidatus Woesearchaeota archaeon]